MNARPLLALAALAAATSPDLGQSLVDLKQGLRDRYAREPVDTVVSTVVVAAWLFYRAERGHNPKVTSYWDALVYVTTNLSVGYSDIFARTSTGKAVGSALMTFGPALTAGILAEPRTAPPSAAPSDSSALDPRILERLDRIVAALEARTEPERGTKTPDP